ncbi:hypothetical protein PR202_gb12327 [Eleusine coracana subsp. coracana]|uniref:GTD-binding domain-containing protein n=1 Tax=Eleusine coracana subsp. coracana TaxID=191504 RepID=A0AAV5EQ83_ELECO|nr:hypothetical protein PR202_gb12327 [Eleusine coracana subsp. coracana]
MPESCSSRRGQRNASSLQLLLYSNRCKRAKSSCYISTRAGVPPRSIPFAAAAATQAPSSMEPAATSSAPAWRGMVRRRSQAWEERERVHRRLAELEADVLRLRAEKKAAERAAAALRADLDAEQGAAETAATEAMAMIARLQREKSAAMIEAREFRRVAEVRAARDRELQDQIAEAYAVAASYRAILRAHGIDDPVVDDDGKAKDKHPVDVSWVAGKTKTVAGDLRARVEALEADSVAVRREVAALRAERAQAVLARRRDDAAGKQKRFPVLGIFKWFFSTISWGTKRSASAAR